MQKNSSIKRRTKVAWPSTKDPESKCNKGWWKQDQPHLCRRRDTAQGWH